jgi:hypothetical protein
MACYLNAQGEMICPTETITVPIDESIWANVQTALSGLPISQRGEKRSALIRKMIEVIAQSPLADECVYVRTNDAVTSLTQILATPSPVLLAFRYATLPGDVLASYFTDRGRLVEAAKVTSRWSTLDASCPPG